MTPLAARLVKRATLPIRDRFPFEDRANAIRLLDDIHCFDVTAVVPLAEELGRQILLMPNDLARDEFVENVTFLPAPRTWIEALMFDGVGSSRVGFLLIDRGDGWADTFVFGSSASDYLGEKSLTGGTAVGKPGDEHLWSFVQCLMVLINTPRIIGRKQHMPNAGLERRLAKARKMVGRFPLHAWTEILLRVRPPEIDEKDYEAHLTGAKALHFCRSHLRIRLGRLEHVSAHWRGDPSLGIKRSRYVVGM